MRISNVLGSISRRKKSETIVGSTVQGEGSVGVTLLIADAADRWGVDIERELISRQQAVSHVHPKDVVESSSVAYQINAAASQGVSVPPTSKPGYMSGITAEGVSVTRHAVPWRQTAQQPEGQGLESSRMGYRRPLASQNNYYPRHKDWERHASVQTHRPQR